MQDLRQELRRFIVENFLFRRDDVAFSDDESFIEGGIVDSTGVLELVSFLEEKYQLDIGETEIVPANLDSVTRLARFVEQKLALKQQATLATPS